MDNKHFDAITQALATDGSRRRVLGVLVGGVAALAGAATLEAKRGGNGKSRGRGRGRNNGGNGGNGNTNGNGASQGQEKVTLCHRNNGKKGFNLITVGAPAVAAHERHGDVICETEDVCSVATGCDDDGACVFGPADEGTACEIDGEAGSCNAEGICVADDPGAEG